MAYIIHRKPTDPSKKKTWVPPNRKYKWLFWPSIILNIILLSWIIFR